MIHDLIGLVSLILVLVTIIGSVFIVSTARARVAIEREKTKQYELTTQQLRISEHSQLVTATRYERSLEQAAKQARELG